MSFKKKLQLIPIFLLAFGFISCAIPVHTESDSKPITHEKFDALLKKHVDSKGGVNYKGFLADSTALANYINYASKHHPNSNHWSKDEQLAYWINVYNAATIQLVLRHYPVESIKDIAGFIPRVNSAWDVKFIHIENETYDLNNIEHSIVRPQFKDPRIHFALVCAAESCPKLRNEAYTASMLQGQLDDQARAFFNNPAKNKIGKDAVALSNLLSWYKGDFTENGTLIDYVNKYANVKANADASITYLDYSWKLNEQ